MLFKLRKVKPGCSLTCYPGIANQNHKLYEEDEIYLPAIKMATNEQF